ncbi:MAG: hypothetical protein HOP07_00755 [Bacteriovoracaceae bacterium]|nr:hypothetical protein [Bacteriovoracaceae bacterium]
MSIDNFIKSGILVKQDSSHDEISDLLKIVERDLADSAQTEISDDWQFGIAYNAALKLANILVRASGYRVKGQGHHMNTIAMIPFILGSHKNDDADYLDTCRRKRNIVEYDCVGGATPEDVKELREFVQEFQKEILIWLSK